MKRILLLLAFLFCTTFLSAAVLTVSNDPANPAQYNRLDTAFAHAQPYDTIYLHGTAVSYGGLAIDKPITLLGTGHHPQKQLPYRSIVGGMGLRSKAIVLDGLVFNTGGGGSFDGNAAGLDSIIIRNCEFNWGSSAGHWGDLISNWIIENNIFNNAYPWAIDFEGAPTNNIVIRNNIFYQQIKNSNGGITIDHNIFYSNSVGNAFTIVNSVVSNNIFYIMSPGGAATSTFNNNITFNTTQDTLPYGTNNGSGNIINQDPQLVNFPIAGATFDFTHDYHLKPSSPGVNAATDATDIGLWGGAGFTMTGEPAIPVVRQMDIKNPNVPVGGTLNVHLKSSKAIK